MLPARGGRPPPPAVLPQHHTRVRALCLVGLIGGSVSVCVVRVCGCVVLAFLRARLLARLLLAPSPRCPPPLLASLPLLCFSGFVSFFSSLRGPPSAAPPLLPPALRPQGRECRGFRRVAHVPDWLWYTVRVSFVFASSRRRHLGRPEDFAALCRRRALGVSASRCAKASENGSPQGARAFPRVRSIQGGRRLRLAKP